MSRLKDIREQLNKTQEEAAQELGISQPWLSQIERDPSLMAPKAARTVKEWAWRHGVYTTLDELYQQ